MDPIKEADGLLKFEVSKRAPRNLDETVSYSAHVSFLIFYRLSRPSAFRMQLFLFLVLSVACCVSSLPISYFRRNLVLHTRQNIRSPWSNVTKVDLGDFEPIGEAWLEGDSDSGGEDKGSGDANSVANGYVPGASVGVASSSFNDKGSTSGTSACSK